MPYLIIHLIIAVQNLKLNEKIVLLLGEIFQRILRKGFVRWMSLLGKYVHSKWGLGGCPLHTIQRMIVQTSYGVVVVVKTFSEMKTKTILLVPVRVAGKANMCLL